jgi:hypothetical protein
MNAEVTDSTNTLHKMPLRRYFASAASPLLVTACWLFPYRRTPYSLRSCGRTRLTRVSRGGTHDGSTASLNHGSNNRPNGSPEIEMSTVAALTYSLRLMAVQFVICTYVSSIVTPTVASSAPPSACVRRRRAAGLTWCERGGRCASGSCPVLTDGSCEGRMGEEASQSRGGRAGSHWRCLWLDSQ